jgi:ferredoxin
VAACPTGALESRYAPLGSWRRAISGAREGTVSVVCRAVGGGPFAAAPVPCVSALPAEWLIGLSLAGVKRVILHTADCEACPLCASLEQARSAIQAARVFLTPLGFRLELEHAPGQPPLAAARPGGEAAGVSRRNFLRGVFGAASASVTPLDRLDVLLADGYGWRRALLLDALRRLEDVPDVSLPTRAGYWGGLVVGAACIGCAMCAQFCPTEALRAVEEDGQIGLWLDASRCTACGLCQRVCFKQAITWSEAVSLPAIVSGQEGRLWQGAPSGNPLNKRLKKPSVHP